MNNKIFQQSVSNRNKFARSSTEAFGSGVYCTFEENKKVNWIGPLIIAITLLVVPVLAVVMIYK